MDQVRQAVGEGGGKKAHSWLKGSQSWHPEHAGRSTDPKYGPQEVAEECIEWWSDIWGCSNEEGSGVEGRGNDELDVEELLAGEEWDSQELPILTPGTVKEASRKFKDRTALGQCAC